MVFPILDRFLHITADHSSKLILKHQKLFLFKSVQYDDGIVIHVRTVY